MLTVDACIAPDWRPRGRLSQRRARLGQRPDRQGKAVQDHVSPTRNTRSRCCLAERAARGARRVRPAGRPNCCTTCWRRRSSPRGRYVRAGDRFESISPGYAVVQAQKLTPRFDVPVRSAQLTPDRRTLVLATDPISAAVHYALTLPDGLHEKPREGAELPQHPEIDLDFDLTGCEATWKPTDGGADLDRLAAASRSRCQPCNSPTGSAPHDALVGGDGRAGRTDAARPVRFDRHAAPRDAAWLEDRLRISAGIARPSRSIHVAKCDDSQLKRRPSRNTATTIQCIAASSFTCPPMGQKLIPFELRLTKRAVLRR